MERAHPFRVGHPRRRVRALEAQESFRKSLAKRAEALKSAALERLDRQKRKLELGHEAEDLRAQLSTALQIGSPAAIRDARRELGDVLLDRQRLALEQATVMPTKVGMGGRGVGTTSGFTITIPGGVHLHGIQNLNQLLRELQRVGKTASTPRSGPNAGRRHGI